MKALIVPDVHMKFENMIDTIHDLWRQHRPDKLVLLGDYFDDWGKTSDDALYWRTGDILEYLREDFPTVFLLGNHDIPYLLDEPQRIRLIAQKYDRISRGVCWTPIHTSFTKSMVCC